MYRRKLSATERLYLATKALSQPLSVQFLLEGDGIINRIDLEKAVEKAHQSNPGCRVILRGMLNRSYWQEGGPETRIKEVDRNRWDALSNRSMPVSLDPIDPRKGPVCEIYLIHGSPFRVLFRTLHSVMDGGGLIHWAKDIFRALRGEPCLGGMSDITDYEFARSFGKKEFRNPLSNSCHPPTGLLEGNEEGVVWTRRRLHGNCPGIIPQIARAVAEQVWQRNPTSDVRFMIPTDLRQLKKDIATTGNLSNPIFIKVTPDDTWKVIYNDIIRQLAKRNQTIVGKHDDLMRFVPVSILGFGLKAQIKKMEKKNSYSLTGIISHGGNFDEASFRASGFDGTTGFFIPDRLPLVPIFVGISKIGENTELIVSTTAKLGGGGRLEKLADKIISGLKTAL